MLRENSTHLFKLIHRRLLAKTTSVVPNKRVAIVINQPGRNVLMGIMSVFAVFLMVFSMRKFS